MLQSFGKRLNSVGGKTLHTGGLMILSLMTIVLAFIQNFENDFVFFFAVMAIRLVQGIGCSLVY